MVAPHLAEHKHGDDTVPQLAEVCVSLVPRTLEQSGVANAKAKHLEQSGGERSANSN